MFIIVATLKKYNNITINQDSETTSSNDFPLARYGLNLSIASVCQSKLTYILGR